MIPISVVIITFNEERNIARCIDSVKGVANEVVVVDSFSTDRTKEICLAKGAKFIEHAFEGHIEQKNYALKQSENDWVLSLDADEALSKDLRNSILEVKTMGLPDIYGYTMHRLTNYCGHWVRYCGWYPDTKLRLFNRTKGAWGGVNPHDKVEMFDRYRSAGFLQGDILHYSYYTIDDHYKQVEYFTTIAAQANFDIGKRSTVLNLVINPAIKFIRDYIIKRGFLDGKTGYTISRISAYATYLKYKKMLMLQRDGGI